MEPAWKRALRDVIFEASTRVDKFYNVALIATIVVSVFAVMMDSVASLRADYKDLFL
jgi:voltage-gated potassium channel